MTTQISTSRCQSADDRASREASRANTTPTWPARLCWCGVLAERRFRLTPEKFERQTAIPGHGSACVTLSSYRIEVLKVNVHRLTPPSALPVAALGTTETGVHRTRREAPPCFRPSVSAQRTASAGEDFGETIRTRLATGRWEDRGAGYAYLGRPAPSPHVVLADFEFSSFPDPLPSAGLGFMSYSSICA